MYGYWFSVNKRVPNILIKHLFLPKVILEDFDVSFSLDCIRKFRMIINFSEESNDVFIRNIMSEAIFLCMKRLLS